MTTSPSDWFLSLADPSQRAVSLVLAALASAAAIHAAMGLAVLRRWSLLGLAFAVYALAGFLLNPLADANTPGDLLRMLKSPNGLATASVLQAVLLAAILYLSARQAMSPASRWTAIGLTVVQLVPAVPLVLLMLLAEQVRLAQCVGKPPETAGWEIGLVTASLLALGSLLAMLVPRRWLHETYLWLGVGLLLACMLLPALPAPMPLPMGEVDVGALVALVPFLLAATIIAGIGWCWQAVSSYLKHALQTLLPAHRHTKSSLEN